MVTHLIAGDFHPSSPFSADIISLGRLSANISGTHEMMIQSKHQNALSDHLVIDGVANRSPRPDRRYLVDRGVQ